MATGINVICELLLPDSSHANLSLAAVSFGGPPAPGSFPEATPPKPTCIVTIDIPYPLGSEVNTWSPSANQPRSTNQPPLGIFGFQPLILAGTTTVGALPPQFLNSPVTNPFPNSPVTDRISFTAKPVIQSRPSPSAAIWLANCFQLPANITDRLLVHLTVKGNFIWSAADPNVFLDGEAFGALGAETIANVGLTLPSG